MAKFAFAAFGVGFAMSVVFGIVGKTDMIARLGELNAALTLAGVN